MDDRRTVSTTRQSSSEITRVTFTTLRKGGLDPNEVRLHLEAVAREMGHLEQPRSANSKTRSARPNERAANPTSSTRPRSPTRSAPRVPPFCARPTKRPGRVTAEAQERSAQVFTETQQRSASHLIEAQERATRCS
jgi:DivIVA domain-containing protein